MSGKVISKRDAVLHQYLLFPSRDFHLRELSRFSGVSFPWTRKIVDDLVQEQLIEKRHERNLVLTRADRDGPFTILKRTSNLQSIYDSGLVKYLQETFSRPQTIILFGSYEKGEDFEKSDIDIAVISKRKPKLDLKPFETSLHRTISVQVLDAKQREKGFWNSLANGTVLYGYLEMP